MVRYYVTDRGAAGGIEPLLRSIEAAAADYIQIREKDLSAAALLDLTRRALRVTQVPILVNGRADIAVAAGAQGIHLPGGSIAPREFRRLGIGVIAVSCHTLDEVRAAEGEGADFVVFGPVFATPGKGPPVGLDALERAAASVRIPVLALGGITAKNANLCALRGAAGIAGIRMFQKTAQTADTSIT
ncbi:MAG: thiamine phosphate synthase [Bryobacteraceae bacterium]